MACGKSRNEYRFARHRDYYVHCDVLARTRHRIGRDWFAEPTKKLAAELLVIMMPTLMLGALLNMLMAMLNSLDRFVAPALIFLALNAGIIITVILLSPMLGVAAVAWGFLIGVTLQVVVQFIELRLEHPRFYWRIDWRHPALRQVWRAFVPITALSLVAQINYVIDKVMATTLPAGSVGALYYADSVLGLFLMIGISLGIGVFPSLSRLVAENDLASAGRAVTQSLRLLIFVLTPLTILLIPFALPLVGLILGRGKFDASAVILGSSHGDVCVGFDCDCSNQYFTTRIFRAGR